MFDRLSHIFTVFIISKLSIIFLKIHISSALWLGCLLIHTLLRKIRVLRTSLVAERRSVILLNVGHQKSFSIENFCSNIYEDKRKILFIEKSRCANAALSLWSSRFIFKKAAAFWVLWELTKPKKIRRILPSIQRKTINPKVYTYGGIWM